MLRISMISIVTLTACSSAVAPGSDVGSGDTTTTSDAETSAEGESGANGDMIEDDDESTDDDDSSTGAPDVCGDNIVGTDEECDDGNQVNADACLNDCTLPSCGDGHIQIGVEECDDGNFDESDGCMSVCVVPRTCMHLLSLLPQLADGDYLIDPDGFDAGAPFPVYCDMTTASGGWTLVEKAVISKSRSMTATSRVRSVG